MSNLEKWIKAILNEEADNLSIGSVRTLQMIKHEFERLQKQVEQQEDKVIEDVKEYMNDLDNYFQEDKIEVISAKVKDRKLVAEIEVEENKISDEDLKVARKVAYEKFMFDKRFNNLSPQTKQKVFEYFEKEACLQKGSEDKK